MVVDLELPALGKAEVVEGVEVTRELVGRVEVADGRQVLTAGGRRLGALKAPLGLVDRESRDLFEVFFGQCALGRPGFALSRNSLKSLRGLDQVVEVALGLKLPTMGEGDVVKQHR